MKEKRGKEWEVEKKYCNRKKERKEERTREGWHE